MIRKRKLSIKSYLYPYRVNFNFRIKDLNKSYKNQFFLIDEKIFDKYKLKKIISKDKFLLIKSNEKSKSFENLIRIINFLLKKNINRKDIIFAIGGGVVQDIAGFVSSILLRGVEWRFFPTTILSQCDSCIGGKTSINFGGTKNKVGNFYPPKEIYIDTNFISSLNERELRSGVGEMAHCFFVKDKNNFNFFSKNFKEGINKNLSVLTKLIYKSLLIKKRFIEKDEFDKGPRLILNYGHSFGHALEKITNYQLPHGIAVAHGMNIANFVSWKKKLISLKEFEKLNRILKIIWGKFDLKAISINKYIEAIKEDKKNIRNLIRVILTRGIGKMFIYEFKEIKHLKKLLIEYCNYNQIKIKI